MMVPPKDLRVSNTGDYFVHDSKPFFYLADTVWSAFTKITMEEWKRYLKHRTSQGFNVLQINILPQWDASQPDLGIDPYCRDAAGAYDYTKLNPAYFERAARMVEMAVENGFIPALVVLWSSYVKGTMHSQWKPENIMPLDRVIPYVDYALKVFSRFNPLYIISGDTDFRSSIPVDYYMTAAKRIRAHSPDALITYHLQPGTDIPEDFIEAGLVDFYMYQSGHEKDFPDRPYTIAQKLYHKETRLPVLNGEPCYEGMGDGRKYDRHSRLDIRRAIWQSLLSGAKAGVTYGAHGIWPWYVPGDICGDDFGGVPYPWYEALHFKGAWDASFARYIFEHYSLFDLEPVLLPENLPADIRMSISSNRDKFAVYLPFPLPMKLDMDLSQYRLWMIHLEDRYFGQPEVHMSASGSIIGMGHSQSDTLIIGLKI